MIHSSYFKPTIVPINGADQNKAEIDRLQDMSASVTIDRSKIEEIGRKGIVDWRKGTPTVNLSLRQLEYGSLEFFRKLANLGSTVNTVDHEDFNTSQVDVSAYKTDDNGTFLGTVWYPGLRMSSFSISIGDPNALVERNFTLNCENEITLLNANKYLIYKAYTITTTGLNRTVTISDPAPVADPDDSGAFLFRVVKVSGTTSTELNDDEWSYDGASTLTINGSSSAGDLIKVWYSAGTYISGQDPFVQNDTDQASISADSASIYLASSNYLYKLQSCSFEVALSRFDLREIGKQDVVQRGVRDTTVSVSLGRILESYTIEEVLRGKAGQSYGKIDIRELSDNFSLIIKLYSDNTKTNFLMGYKVTDLAPVGKDLRAPLNDYIQVDNRLEGEEFFITTNEASL